jgi:hypothetical protein
MFCISLCEAYMEWKIEELMCELITVDSFDHKQAHFHKQT